MSDPDSSPQQQSPEYNLERLTKTLQSGASAIVFEQHLEPTVPGAKIQPPTYPTSKEEERKTGLKSQHIVEDRRINGETVRTVTLLSVAAAANAMETALKNCGVEFPKIVTSFLGTNFQDLGEISSLDAPHRTYDAILRDSLVADEKVVFDKSTIGQELATASVRNATPLLRYDPIALVLGVWNSTSATGGRGTKIARRIVSEIIGLNWVPGVKAAVRVDPIGIEKGDDLKVKIRNPSERDASTLIWAFESETKDSTPAPKKGKSAGTPKKEG